VVDPVERDARGILAPDAGLQRFRLTRHEPSATVARFVDRYWVAEWDLPPGHTYPQHVLTHPVVNIVIGVDGATVSGVRRTRFTALLEGRGRVLGIMFRPAGFRPLLAAPMSAITDRVLPLAEVLGPVDLGERPEPEDVDAWLGGIVPPDPQPSERTTLLVERVAADRSVRRVDELADIAGVGIRALQRDFADHVGISPKWVIRRYRLYEAAEQAARGSGVGWASLATELGYSDQSHLTRDFTAAVGMPPDAYARRCTAGSG
jgi:AraC-like DNA-binding protein